MKQELAGPTNIKIRRTWSVPGLGQHLCVCVCVCVCECVCVWCYSRAMFWLH